MVLETAGAAIAEHLPDGTPPFVPVSDSRAIHPTVGSLHVFEVACVQDHMC